MNYYRLDFGGFTALVIQSREDLSNMIERVTNNKVFVSRNGTVWNLQHFQTLSKINEPDDRVKLQAQTTEGFR